MYLPDCKLYCIKNFVKFQVKSPGDKVVEEDLPHAGVEEQLGLTSCFCVHITRATLKFYLALKNNIM